MQCLTLSESQTKHFKSLKESLACIQEALNTCEFMLEEGLLNDASLSKSPAYQQALKTRDSIRASIKDHEADMAASVDLLSTITTRPEFSESYDMHPDLKYLTIQYGVGCALLIAKLKDSDEVEVRFIDASPFFPQREFCMKCPDETDAVIKAVDRVIGEYRDSFS